MSLRKSATFTIIGSPIPLFRARPNYHQRRMWDSQSELKTYWKLLLEKMHKNRPPFAGPLSLRVFAFIELPVCRRKKWSSLTNTYHGSPPDASNIVKWVEDCCQLANLFKNDCLIADTQCIKIWTTEPKTVFTITELDPLYQINLQDYGLNL